MKAHALQHKGKLLNTGSSEAKGGYDPNEQAASGLDPETGLGLNWKEGGFADEDDDN